MSNYYILEIPPYHVELAHGPVNDPHDAVDERDTHGHERVDQADDYPRYDVLGDKC